MMIRDAMNDDALSLAMLWAGALMVFTPLLGAGAVLTVWWRQRAKRRTTAAAAVEPDVNR